jgi:hypothetical protein
MSITEVRLAMLCSTLLNTLLAHGVISGYVMAGLINQVWANLSVATNATDWIVSPK